MNIPTHILLNHHFPRLNLLQTGGVGFLSDLHPGVTPSIAEEQHLAPFPRRLWAVEAAQGTVVAGAGPGLLGVVGVVHVHREPGGGRWTGDDV